MQLLPWTWTLQTLSGTGDVDAEIVVNLAGSTNVLKRLPSPLPKTTGVPHLVYEVKVNPPPAVTEAHVTQLLGLVDPDDDAPQTSDRRESGFISITKRSKVVLGNPALTISDDGNTVRINIVKMDTGGIVELTYKKMWAAKPVLVLPP